MERISWWGESWSTSRARTDMGDVWGPSSLTNSEDKSWTHKDWSQINFAKLPLECSKLWEQLQGKLAIGAVWNSNQLEPWRESFWFPRRWLGQPTKLRFGRKGINWDFDDIWWMSLDIADNSMTFLCILENNLCRSLRLLCCSLCLRHLPCKVVYRTIGTSETFCPFWGGLELTSKIGTIICMIDHPATNYKDAWEHKGCWWM